MFKQTPKHSKVYRIMTHRQKLHIKCPQYLSHRKKHARVVVKQKTKKNPGRSEGPKQLDQTSTSSEALTCTTQEMFEEGLLVSHKSPEHSHHGRYRTFLKHSRRACNSIFLKQSHHVCNGAFSQHSQHGCDSTFLKHSQYESNSTFPKHSHHGRNSTFTFVKFDAGWMAGPLEKHRHAHHPM